MSHKSLSSPLIFDRKTEGILNIVLEMLLSVRKRDRTRNGKSEGISDFKHIFIPL